MYAYAAIMRPSARAGQSKPPRDPEAPLDAEDLSRRLSAHITAQERATRRRSRAHSLPLALRPNSWLSSGSARDVPSSSLSTASTSSDLESPPPPPLVRAQTQVPYHTVRTRSNEARNWRAVDWGRGTNEGEGEVGGLVSLKGEKSTRRRFIRVLEMGLEKVNMRRRSSVNKHDLITEMISQNYNWDDSIPATMHVEEGLEKCVTSSTRDSDSKRSGGRSRRASFLARFKWLRTQESSN